jgi:hypothetical protein
MIDSELFEFEIRYDLEKLQGLLRPGVRLTLIIRDPSNHAATLIFGNDQALKEILEQYFRNAKRSIV